MHSEMTDFGQAKVAQKNSPQMEKSSPNIGEGTKLTFEKMSKC